MAGVFLVHFSYFQFQFNFRLYFIFSFHAVLLRCWLGGRKGIWPLKKLEWWSAGMVICLWQDAADATATHCLLLQ